MKYVLLALCSMALVGCEPPAGPDTGKYALFETSKGTVYRLNTTTGETHVIYSPEGLPALTVKTLYHGDLGKTYEYLGRGELKELSPTEAADRLVEKYTK